MHTSRPRPDRARRRSHLATPIVAGILLAALAGPALAQDVSEETVEFFRMNCTSCHTIGGGRLTGPDLKNVTARQSREWLATFVMDPKGTIDGGDAYAQQLFKEANGQLMIQVPGMTRERAMALLDLIEVESAKEKSRFVGLQLSDRALTEVDVERGRRIFAGEVPLAAGGPACIGCHSVDGIGGFGGGRLGPDLTDAFSRLEGRKALSAWLGSPASVTMQPLFKDHPIEGEEMLGIVAYLKARAESGARPGAAGGPLSFLLAGFTGVVGTLVLFDLIWRRRFRAVRRPLVKGMAR